MKKRNRVKFYPLAPVTLNNNMLVHGKTGAAASHVMNLLLAVAADPWIRACIIPDGNVEDRAVVIAETISRFLKPHRYCLR